MNALADALRLAEELKHPLTTVIALWFAAWVHYHRGDRVATKAVVERALTLAADYGISGWSDTRVLLPWVSGARLDRRELAELNDQIPKVASTAWRRVFSRCALAKLYIAAGHFDEGLRFSDHFNGVDQCRRERCMAFPPGPRTSLPPPASQRQAVRRPTSTLNALF
jgi:hypothetical protein